MKWKYSMRNPCFSDSHPQKYWLDIIFLKVSRECLLCAQKEISQRSQNTCCFLWWMSFSPPWMQISILVHWTMQPMWLGDSTPLVPLSLQASLVYRLPYFPLHFNHSHVYQATLSISGGQGGVIHQPIWDLQQPSLCCKLRMLSLEDFCGFLHSLCSPQCLRWNNSFHL